MFKWQESFSVGIPLIDEQHKRLFEIGNQIHNLLKNYNHEDVFDAIIDQVEALEKYTIYHFNEEEKLLELYNYEDLEVHKEQHAKFIDYLSNLNFNKIDRDQEAYLNELTRFIASWIFKHISNDDFKYSGYISTQLGKL